MAYTPGPYIIGESGGPAGPFYNIVNSQGNVVAMQILNRDDAVLWKAAPDLLAACAMQGEDYDQPVGPSAQPVGPSVLYSIANILEEHGHKMKANWLRTKADMERAAIPRPEGRDDIVARTAKDIIRGIPLGPGWEQRWFAALDFELASLRADNADLLAACETALEDGKDYRLSETIKRRLWNAIAKARGEAGGNESERQCQLNTKWQGCCCRCQYHLRDVVHSYAAGHPVTSDEKEQRGWACAVAFMLYHEREVYSGWPEHGFCELNDPGVEEQDDEPGT